MPNPFSWDYLNSVPPSNDVIDGWSMLCLLVFGSGFLLSSAIFYRPGLPLFRGKYKRKTVQFVAGVGLWIFGAGLFFFLIQLLQIDPFTFGRRIWMFLSFLASLVFVAFVAFAWWQRASEVKAVISSPSGATIQRPAPQRRPVRRRRI
ncbi:MAG: hypothetical protein WKF81_02045 [Thermomicrobiales bacterium]